jgi:hypothetical protein
MRNSLRIFTVTAEGKRSFGSLDVKNRKRISEEHYILESCFMKVTNIERSVNIHFGNTSNYNLKMLFALDTWLPSVRHNLHVYRLLNQKCGEQVLQNLRHTQQYFR